MPIRRSLARLAPYLAAALVTACGGGGSSSQDVVPGGGETSPAVVAGPDQFLLFPNPQAQANGQLQTNTLEYAEAYYAAVDPNGERTTLARFRTANGFGSGTGTEITVVFGDRRDLGYGRRMVVRRNPNGNLAFVVENYLIEAGAGYAYSPLNLEAAIVRDLKWRVGINGIEFSPGPNGGPSFPKFFNFDGVTEERRLAVDLDGRGEKAMPGPCISCHGGRGDALTPPDATGKRKFNLVQNSASKTRGDVVARLHPFEADAFDFSTRAGYTRADQEAAIKEINKIILCSYPLATPSPHPEDACRPAAVASNWQGTAATLIKSAYGGDGLPSATFHDDYVPQSWLAAGQSSLYKSVIATSCRTCHVMRGTSAQSDIDFSDFEKFTAFADRTKYHVFDRGNMPLAKIVYEAFWGTPERPELLANFLQERGHTVRDSAGAVLKPGRPIADPGPDRVVLPGATALSASNSLYATSYSWSIVSGTGASLANAGTAQPTFTANASGPYVLQLIARNGGAQSAPATLRVVVDSTLTPAPSAIRFADVKALLQGAAGCTSCHSPTGPVPRPPLNYTNDDRNGDGIAGDPTDDAWFYGEVRSRINFTDLAASPLLRKPSGNQHSGGLIGGFDTAAAPGTVLRARYDLFLNWILNGAPQ